jgi:hypothetical protein
MKSSYKILGFATGLIALALAGAWGFVLWQSAGLRDKIATASTQAEGAQAREVYLIGLKKALSDARESGDEIAARFIREDAVPAFIDRLEARIAQSGADASLGSISLDDPTEGSQIRALRLRVSGTGTWKESMALVSSLESMKSLIDIRTLSLLKAAGAERWSVSADLIQQVSNE